MIRYLPLPEVRLNGGEDLRVDFTSDGSQQAVGPNLYDGVGRQGQDWKGDVT